MNAKELIASANEVLEACEGYEQEHHLIQAYADCARHVLATVCEDDDEPIDFPIAHEIMKANPRLRCDGNWEWWVAFSPIHSVNIGQFKTRGQLRGLLRAMGCEVQQ